MTERTSDGETHPTKATAHRVATGDSKSFDEVPSGRRTSFDEEPSPAREVSGRRPLIANCVPIGVAGFALTTFTLGLYTAGVLAAPGEEVVLYLALVYGGATQFIAGFFALARGDIFPAAFMTTYGAFWFSFVALNLFVVPAVTTAGGPAVANQTVLVYLVMWTIITAIFWVCTLNTNGVVFLAFSIFLAAIIILDIAQATGSTGLKSIGGYLEMALAAVAWYIVTAELFNEMRGKVILPMLPFRHVEA